MDLPPLTDWLGLRGLDTERVELFDTTDLGQMSLSQYLSSAYDADVYAAPADIKRIDALAGPVLIVPTDAMDGPPAPGPEATGIAVFNVAETDTKADLPQATVPVQPATEVASAPERSARVLPWVVIVGLGAAAILVWLVS